MVSDYAVHGGGKKKTISNLIKEDKIHACRRLQAIILSYFITLIRILQIL